VRKDPQKDLEQRESGKYSAIFMVGIQDLPGAAERITRLCSELRIRIELLRELIGMRGNN